MKIDYSLYLIIDDTLCLPENMLDMVKRLSDYGVTCIQLRMKLASSAIIADIGKSLLDILKPKKIPLLINDSVDIAAEINADGVHIGQKDISYLKAREQLGRQKIIGLSIENIEQAKKCCHDDIDYFGVGPVFPTSTKPDAATPLGIQQLSQITKILKKPVVAIGGINKNNMTTVLQAGVAGIAFVSAILSAKNPALETTHLNQMIHFYRGIHDAH